MATVGRRGRAAVVRVGGEGCAAAGRRGRRRGAGEGGGAARETEMGEEGGERREPSRGVGEVGTCVSGECGTWVAGSGREHETDEPTKKRAGGTDRRISISSLSFIF